MREDNPSGFQWPRTRNKAKILKPKKKKASIGRSKTPTNEAIEKVRSAVTKINRRARNAFAHDIRAKKEQKEQRSFSQDSKTKTPKGQEEVGKLVTTHP